MNWWMDPEHAKHAWDFGIAAVGALAGTAAGAWVAVQGDRKRNTKEIQDRHVEAANVAIFSLSLVYTYVVEYHLVVIQPLKDNPHRWYRISASVMPPPSLMPFDVGQRLAFLFESPHKNLPNRLSIEFQRFTGLLDLTRRAGEANKELQAICAAKDPIPQDLAEIEEAIGEVRTAVLNKYVDGIIDLVEGMAPSVMAAALALRTAMLSLYPRRTIVQFAPELLKVP